MFSSMSNDISLPVTINIQPSHHTPTPQRLLPDGGVNFLAAPCDVTRKTNVDGYQLEHKTIFSSVSSSHRLRGTIVHTPLG